MDIIKIIFKILRVILLCIGTLTVFAFAIAGCTIYNTQEEFNPDIGKTFIPDENHELYPEGGFREPENLADDFYSIRSLEQQDRIFDSNTFRIYNSLQGGIYTYDAWLRIPEHGRIYIKAYELKTGIELTPERIEISSSIEVKPTNGEVERFSLPGSFKIYEGEWGEYYVARIELWYAQVVGQQAPRKILEDYYIVEGWER